MEKTYIQEKLIGVEGQIVSFDYNEKAILRNIDSNLGAVLIVTCGTTEITVSDTQGSILVRNTAQQFIPLNADYYITSDGDTLYTQASNKFIVNLPRIGTWTISATVNGINLNRTIFIDGAGTYYVDLSVFNARIEVSYPTGAICTCTNNDIILTADSTDGSFIFNVPYAGEWVITAYTATASAVSRVNIYLNGQYESVELNFIYTTLDENTWEAISEISRYGEASSYWSIGDIKHINLNGRIGTVALSNYPISVFIIGFDHNNALESDGASTITFAIGKSAEGINTAFIDSEYGGSDKPGDSYFTYARSSSYAPQGYYYWLGSKLRLEYLGQDKSNPRGLLSALPDGLVEVIKPVRKTSFNNRNEGASITSENELLFLFSLYEIIGQLDYEPNNSLVSSTQKQYTYFENNSPIAYRYNDTTTSCTYWTRSVQKSDGGSTVEYYCISKAFDGSVSINDINGNYDRAIFAAFNV